FLVALFIFNMQFLWKYVDDLMGKGLPWITVAQLLFYAAASAVPLAIPLAVLLSSIMTMGGLGERSELVPMRSAGLGLFRIMLPLTMTALLIAALSFWFSNNALPLAELKFRSLLWDVTHKKPALNLRPGVFFNGIDGFTIRISGKDEESGELRDVLIYDHRSAFQSDRTVVRAERGRMKRSTDGNYLILELENGHVYDEQAAIGGQRGDRPLLRGRFARDELRLDLSGLALKRTDEDLFKDNYRMLTLGQLGYVEDSLSLKARQRELQEEGHLLASLRPTRPDSIARQLTRSHVVDSAQVARLAVGDPARRSLLYEAASNAVRDNISFLDRMMEDREAKRARIVRYDIEWHRKLMLSFACIVFFFIGAPLGAIVRKGGMGLPAVWAIVFFLIFHIISYSTEQLVKTGELAAWPGMWISTFVLLPIGAYLTWQAATDSPLLDADAWSRGWDKLRARIHNRARTPAVP
ncbi:MAG TPA: LptF/LptG family permease, partial [Flavobacteriales bacterium]|nr:LptF/LptG family permease [Flavobacteriales bacterium]